MIAENLEKLFDIYAKLWASITDLSFRLHSLLNRNTDQVYMIRL